MRSQRSRNGGLGGPLTRRQAGRYAAATAVAAAASGVVMPGGAAAAPTRGSGVVNIIYQTNWQGATWNQTAWTLVQQFVDSTFNSDSHYKGIRATVTPSGQGNASGVIASVIAGAPGIPDIVESCCEDIAVYESQNFIRPLDPYVSTSNLDVNSLFIAGHLQSLTIGGTLYALPSYDAPPALYYRQDILDTLGLPYPTPNWTYDDAVRLWTQCTDKKSKTPRAGVSLYAGTELEWLYRAYGGTTMNAARNHCELNSNACINGAKWWFSMLLDGVAINRDDPGSIYGQNPAAVFCMCGGWDLLPALQNLRGTKWNIAPMPVGPVGYSTTFDNIDFYAMLTSTKHPNEAWQLLEWLAAKPTYTQYMMKVNLTGPALLSMWDEWETLIRQVAPPVAGKDIQYHKDAALSGHSYPRLHFVQGDNQAQNLISNWQTKIQNRQVSVNEAYVQMTKQVNAWIGEAATFQKKENAMVAALGKVAASPTAVYPGTPATTGVGVPYSKSPYIIAKSGTYTMLGDGWDIYNSTDNCTFAGIPLTATEGEWVCRVVSVANISCPQPSVWCKFGLMARGDLSDDAPYASVHVTGANQIEWAARTAPEETPGGSSGLVPKGTSNLMKPVATKTSNYLIQPLWLKMTRKGLSWYAYASLDGKTWTSMTPNPLIAEFGTGWVGIMSTAHNGDFNNKGYVRAVYDHLNFTPTQLLQIGQLGVPPAAGPVPKNWATM